MQTTTPAPHAGPALLSPDGYRTAPDHHTTGWPPGIPYIVGNEACERFSYYGMRAVLVLHLVGLYQVASLTETAAKASAKEVTHLFFAGVYALPMIGALLADRLLGKYRTILFLSLVYCAGHAVLAVAENTLTGMYVGLGLIAIGSGGIKPCVSANVGDQFGRGNSGLVRTVFQIFYFSVNFGSFFAYLIIPWTYHAFGPGVAFGIPGLFMFAATVVFWLGRYKYVHVPPKPGGELGWLDALSSICLFLSLGHLFLTAHSRSWWEGLMPNVPWWIFLVTLSLVFLAAGLVLFQRRQHRQPDDGFLAITLHCLTRLGSGSEQSASSGQWFWGAGVERFGAKAVQGPVAVLRIVSVFFLMLFFWALFDQHSSSWILQAAEMNRTFELPLIGSFTLDPQQTGSANPLLVMLLIPLMTLGYTWLDQRGVKVTPLRLMTVGMGVTAISFAAIALVQQRIDVHGQGQVSWLWQLIPYVILTIAEVMVSVTALEFAYSQAPLRMKSTVMGFWNLTVSLGNVLVSVLVGPFKDYSAAEQFWIYTGLMAVATLLFAVRAAFYVPNTPQD